MQLAAQGLHTVHEELICNLWATVLFLLLPPPLLLEPGSPGFSFLLWLLLLALGGGWGGEGNAAHGP